MTNESNDDGSRPYFEVWLEYMRSSTGLALTPSSVPSLNWRGAGVRVEGLNWPQDSYRRDFTFGPQNDQVIRTELDIPVWDQAPEGIQSISCQGDQQYAYTHNDGAILFFAPEDVAFRTETEGHPLALLLAPIEEFLKGWKLALPKRLATTFYQHKVQRLDRMESERIEAAREAARLMLSVESEQKRALDLRRTEMSLLAITEEDFLESANRWMQMLDNVGGLEIKQNCIVLTMNEFATEGVQLGPFEISLSTETFQPKVTALRNKSYDGYPHPHVEHSGAICWGGGSNVRLFQQVVAQINPLEILFYIANFLKTGYSAGGAYRKLSDWAEDRTGQWQCQSCDEYHNDGENCPRHCSSCDNEDIDLSTHRTCRVHWNCYDTGDECYQCADERQIQEEERLELEAATRETARVAAHAAAVAEASEIEDIEDLRTSIGSIEVDIAAFQGEGCTCEDCIAGEATAETRRTVFREELASRGVEVPDDAAPDEGSEEESSDESPDEEPSNEDQPAEGSAVDDLVAAIRETGLIDEQPYGENHPLWDRFLPEDRWVLQPETELVSIESSLSEFGGALIDLDDCANDDCDDCAVQAVEVRAREVLYGEAVNHFRATPPVRAEENAETSS